MYNVGRVALSALDTCLLCIKVIRCGAGRRSSVQVQVGRIPDWESVDSVISQLGCPYEDDAIARGVERVCSNLSFGGVG